VSGRLLLIGGTGFLGSFVAIRLASREPLVLVRPTSDRRVLPPRVEVRVGELSRPLPLDGVETLVYCASMGFGQVPALVQQVDSAGVRRAIFVSTTAIYTSLPAPSREVRLKAEEAVQTSSLNWTIVRPTMIYGTQRDRNISRLLRFLHRWPIFPQCGNALWQPVHVEDVADAIVSVLETPATYRRAYNLGGAQPLRFAELLRTAARAVGRRVLLVPVPLAAAALGARLTRAVSEEQVRRLAEDKAFPFTEASADFGYCPRSFEEGARAEARLLGLALRPARPSTGSGRAGH
jgi:nucleoside-diphosphate-sugar epimerase